MKTASIAINASIVLLTAIMAAGYFHKDGEWRLEYGLKALRYFTLLSNVFCAIGALAMFLAQLRGEPSPGVVLLKYMGTASVSITMLTVLLFLGPTQGWGIMLTGRNLYLHLIGPLLAITSFCFLEKRGMSLTTAMLGLVPVAVYGAVYLYKVIYAPEGQRWEDFYGFNRGGKWPLILGIMLLGSAAVCLALRALGG